METTNILKGDFVKEVIPEQDLDYGKVWHFPLAQNVGGALKKPQ